MSKSTVITLVDDLSLTQTNTTETAVIYDEIVRELGFLEILTGTEILNVTKNISDYEVSPLTIRSLEFYNTNKFLTKTNDIGIAALFGSIWRKLSGDPIAVSMDDEDSNTFTLVPSPIINDTLTIIRTEYRQDVPVWLELPIAFEILSREYMRESDHQDIELATLCKQVADLLFSMVGVDKNA